MDRLSLKQTDHLQNIICDVEEIINVSITQDTDKEILVIEDLNIGRTTIMNCACNSAKATIKQVCGHLNRGTLFSYDEHYIIGACS